MGRVVIIAGETSGDRLGASLIRAAKRRHPEVQFEGVTGPLMREAGCETWFDYQDLAVMGFFEVLGHLPRLLRRKRQIERRLLADPPDALVGVDAPDFNLRVERVAKRHGIPTVHYVCPTVWAWRQGRVHGLGRSADHVLCLFPFEAEFLAEHGIDAASFDKAFTSFEVETKVRRASDLVRRYYRISGVPTLIVNGKFKTGGSMAGNRIFDVIDFLVEQEADAS